MAQVDDDMIYNFAAELLRNGNDLPAAAKAVTDDLDARMQLSAIFYSRTHPGFLQALDDLSNQDYDVADLLPDKVHFARNIWQKATDCHDPEIAQKWFRLYAETMGFLTKPGGNTIGEINVHTTVVKAIPQPVYDSEDDLQEMIKQQQRMLVEGTLYKETPVVEHDPDENAA
jgi:hypothetical protein